MRNTHTENSLLVPRFSRKYVDDVERIQTNECASDDVAARKRSPYARVGGNAAIVAKHEIFFVFKRDAQAIASIKVRGIKIWFIERESFRMRFVHYPHGVAVQCHCFSRKPDDAFDERFFRVVREVDRKSTR